MEAIFEDVRSRLAGRIESHTKICSCYNDGYFTKFYNILEAGLNQTNGINHVTGEVHFINLLMRKRTSVLTIHDCAMMERKSGLSQAIVRRLYLNYPVARARIITANSETTKKSIVRYTGCPPDKIRVINVAVDEMYHPFPKTFNETCPRILQIGTGYNKNIPRLAEALAGLKCELAIVGRLSEDQIKLLNQHRIDYENLYNLSNSDMLEQYKQCDIVSFPSTFEGFGMPIVEGQMVERVVVTSNVSSMPEVAGSGACLVDPFDIHSIRSGFDRVICDPTYRELLIESGRGNRERFDAQRIAEQYFEIYQEISASY